MAENIIQRELSGSTSKVVTESGALKVGQGVLRGILTTATSSGTLVIYDGTEASTGATTTLTSSGACVPAVHGSTTLTSNGTNVTDGKIVTIGAITYRFKTTMAAAYDVQIGASAAVTLDNLKAAINASGTAGTEYYAGTLAHTYFVASTNTDTTQVIVARTVVGTTATATLNALVTTTNESTLSWTGGTLGDATASVTTAGATITIGSRVYTVVTNLSETSGASAVADQVIWVTNEETFLDNLKQAINQSGLAGTDYSTGTTVNTQVEATTNTANTQVINARVLGVSGNAIATSTTLANYAFTSTVMASGAGADARLLLNTYTPAAGSQITFNNIEFENGLYFTVGGTSISATVSYK
jgi:hypothetical protein